MIQITPIDATAWGFILVFFSGIVVFQFIERHRVLPLAKDFDELRKLTVKLLGEKADNIEKRINKK